MRDLIKEIPLLVAFSTYLSWTLLFLIGHIRDALARFWGGTHNKVERGYAALRQDYEDFYQRRAYYRVIGCFNRPVVSAPTRVLDLLIRTGKPAMPEQVPTGETRTVINLGSYNYLGFASQVRRARATRASWHAQLSRTTCEQHTPAAHPRTPLPTPAPLLPPLRRTPTARPACTPCSSAAARAPSRAARTAAPPRRTSISRRASPSTSPRRPAWC